MMVESGVEDASLEGYSVSNIAAVEKEALAAAVADARAKAEAIAAAGGTRIVRMRRVQYGRDFAARFADTEEIVVTGSRLARLPKIALELAPQPIPVRAEVAAEFELQ
jgi:uncharacterized protein YggE